VVASTSGRGLDPDGYIAVLDPGLPGSESGRLDVNGSVVFPTVAPGEHTVELGEVADHCVVSPSGPQAVSVSGGQHSFVAFSVLCSGEPFPSNRIAFASDRDGFSEIYVMDADGSNQTRITHDMGLDLAPAFAPDAQHIAFETAGSQSEIFATYADGTGPVKLTHSAGPDVQATWSPDGSKIAFMSDPHDGSPGIFVMNSDGSDRHRVTSFKIGDNPSWSPDGSRIVFETGGHDSQIEVMNADGSQRHTIALINGHHPAWSPDGGLIAFDVDYPEELAGIVLIEPDGRPAGWVTRGSDALPTWSPDSRRIAFQRSDGHDLEIFVIDVDGTNLTQLTHNKAADTHPSWSR
jgi:Tol biopolymer transport system component